MKKKTSLSLSETILKRADAVALKAERSRSWILEKAIDVGLPLVESRHGIKANEEPSASGLRTKKKRG